MKLFPHINPILLEILNEADNYRQDGVILIKGRTLEDGTQRLYAAYVKYTGEHNRVKADNSEGKAVTMVTLNNQTNIYRVKIEDGRLKANGVDFPDKASKAKNLEVKGSSVGLNDNKTPLHWETLGDRDIGAALSKNSGAIMNLDNIRWTN